MDSVAAFQAAEQEEFDDLHVDDGAEGPLKTCGAATAQLGAFSASLSDSLRRR